MSDLRVDIQVSDDILKMQRVILHLGPIPPSYRSNRQWLPRLSPASDIVAVPSIGSKVINLEAVHLIKATWAHNLRTNRDTMRSSWSNSSTTLRKEGDIKYNPKIDQVKVTTRGSSPIERSCHITYVTLSLSCY